MLGMKARVSSGRVSLSSRDNSIQHAFVPVPSTCNAPGASCARQRQKAAVSSNQHPQPRQSTVVAMCTSSAGSPAVAVEAESPAVEDLLEITQENYYSYLADAPVTELVVVDFYTDVSETETLVGGVRSMVHLSVKSAAGQLWKPEVCISVFSQH